MARPGRRAGLVRGHDDRELKRGHDIKHLPAVAPGVTHVAPADLAQKPAIAVPVPREPRVSASPPRELNPFGRDNLLASHRLSATAVKLAEDQKRPRAHGHLIAAKVHALRIALPTLDREVLQR